MGRRAGRRLGLILTILLAAAVAGAASADLLVTESERWIDTVKGKVKNFAGKPARDVTLVVKFYDRWKKGMGKQTVKVGTIPSGEEKAFSFEIREKYRKAESYDFTPRAVWK